MWLFVGAGYGYRLVDLCSWIFHCHSSKAHTECSGQNQSWIPLLEIQNNFTYFKNLLLQLAWGAFIPSCMIFFLGCFSQFGNTAIVGLIPEWSRSFSKRCVSLGSLCSDSCVKMNSMFLWAWLLCWLVPLASCCQPGWFSSLRYLELFQCSSYYLLSSCVSGIVSA